MSDTSLTLLGELAGAPDDDLWRRLHDLYAPLLRRWTGRYQMQPSDVDDIVQEVLLVVARELPQFEHSGRTGAFRAWLRTTLVHRLRAHWKARDRRPRATGESDFQQELQQLEDPCSELSGIWDREHDRMLVTQLLRRLERQFSESTRTAFRRVVLEGAAVDVVAAELNMSVNAVTVAKHRVLKELRRQGRGLLGL